MPHIPGHQSSYFDEFLDMGDTQPIKVDDLPDAFASLPTIGNLPPDVVGNTLTSVLAQPQMSREEANRQAGDRIMVEGIQGLAEVLPINDPLNLFSPWSGYPQGMNPDIRGVAELFQALGQERTAGPFEEELKEVRKATEKAAKDFEKFQQSQNAADAAVDRANFAFRTEDPSPVLPPSYGQVDSFGRAGTQGRTFEFADTGPEYTFGISDTLPIGGAKRVGAPEISSFVGNVADTISRIGVPTTSTGKLSGIPTSFSLDPGFSFDPTAVSPTVDASILQGGGGLTEQQIDDAAMAEALRSAEASAAQNALAQSGYLGGEMQFAPMATNVPPITRPSYLDYDPTRVSRTVDESITSERTPVESIVNFDQASPTDTQTDTAPEPVDTAPEPTDTEAPILTGEFPTNANRGDQFRVEGGVNQPDTIYIFHEDNGWTAMGRTSYTNQDGQQIQANFPSGTGETFLSGLDNIATISPPDAPSAQPLAPGAPSFQPTINQFGQPVVQSMGQPITQPIAQPMGQPMGQQTIAPATYGQVLGGTPVEPNPFQQLYESGLEPFDVFKRYQLSQFPGADLGQRLAVQDRLGTGFSPAYGRFLLGTASQRLLGQPTDALDASGGFGRYLTSQPRASLGQLRQEYANLANALGSYQTGLRTDVASPTANYLLAFGSPGEEDYRSNILRATQAALGSPVFRQSTLGNIFDVMEQQYGAGAGSRFADFVRTGFSQQPNMQSMQSFAPTTSNFLAQSQSNPYYGVSSTSAMARQQPVVTPEPTLFGGTMGY